MKSNGYTHFYTFNTRSRHRWLNRELLDILETEYKSKSTNYFKEAIKHGAIKVNHKRTTATQKIGPRDVIQHTVHIHEPISPEIEIIHEESDFIVVNKPSGIACHPTNNYMFFSVTKKLECEYGNLSCVNRLDVPTSGVLILARGNLNVYHKLMQEREIKKVYLAKVKGCFVDQIVKKKLKSIPGKFTVVDVNGKEAETRFKKIKYVNGYSLVECVPLTGRSHQIRVHLQNIGFPIVGDFIYGGEVNNKNVAERNAICDGSIRIPEKVQKREVRNKISNNKDLEISKEKCKNTAKDKNIFNNELKKKTNKENIENERKKKNEKSFVDINEIDQIFNKKNSFIEEDTLKYIIENCEAENNNPYKNKDSEICLHAFKYCLKDNVFVAKLPNWAQEFHMD